MDKHVLAPKLTYQWKPFTLDGVHLTFAQHVTARLERDRCSHWGNAVYKWEGPVNQGPKSGKLGILIGETKDLRQRIKQYVSGTQERGNKLWRETFLTQGRICLDILQVEELTIGDENDRTRIPPIEALASNNIRLILEQLLVLAETSKTSANRWIVNARH